MGHGPWGRGHGPGATGHALWGARPWASSIPARLPRDPQQEPQALGARLHKKTPQNPRLLLRHGPRAMVHAPWSAWPWSSSITARLPRDPQQGPQAMGSRLHKKKPQNLRLLLRHESRAMVHAPWGAWPWASSITARLPRDPQQGPQAMGGRVSKKTPQNPRLLLRHGPRAMVRMAMALRHAPSTVRRECFTFPVSSSAAATNPSPLET